MQVAGYVAPISVGEAVALLREAGESARPLAGGTDLLVQMRTGRRKPGLIVDLKRIPELTRIELDDEGLSLGAAASTAELREHPEIRELYPGLVEAAELIGSEQIQGRSSVGGNLCNASPAADTVPSLIALGAECLIAGPSGLRRVPVETFCTGPGSTVLGHDEILVELRVPRPRPRSADAYLRLIPRSEMDIAVVGAGVSVELDASGNCAAARVSLGAVAPTALLVPEAGAALVGRPVEGRALEALASAATAAARPIDDMRGTVAYRRKVAGVLARRAAGIAAERAAGRGATR